MLLTNMGDRIKEFQHSGAPVIIWGTGEKAKGTVPLLLRYGLSPVCFCDSDRKKWGSTFFGLSVLQPEKARELYPDAIYIICTWIGHYEQIIHELQGSSYYHCNYPFKVDTSFLELRDNQQIELLESMEDALADAPSKEIFRLALNYRLTGDMTPLIDKIDGNTMFDPLLEMRYRPNETYIDCGAYTGDTMIQFLEFCRGNYGRIRLYEGDHNNCNWTNKLIGLTRIQNATVHEQLLWHQKEELEFHTFDIDSDDYVYENGDVSDWRKENPCSRKMDKLEKIGAFRSVRRMAQRLDELVDEDEPIGMIKICVVGADMNALRGCEKIMRRQKPAIVVEWAGCKADDVWEMIPFIKACSSNYKIYLRQKRLWQGSKTVLYAV